MRKLFIWDDKLQKLVEQKVEPKKDYHFVMPDCAGYQSPVDGRLIDGRTQRREDLRRNGCREVDPGERKDFISPQQEDGSFFEDESLTRELHAVAENIGAIEFRKRFGEREVYEISSS